MGKKIKKVYNSDIEKQLKTLTEEKQKTQDLMAKYHKSLKEFEILQYRIEGAIFALKKLGGAE